MTRDPGSGGKGGGSGTGSGKTPVTKTRETKTPITKTHVTEPSGTETPADANPAAKTPVTHSRVTTSPETETPAARKLPAANASATKNPAATKKTKAESSRSKSGAGRTGAPRNGAAGNGRAHAAAAGDEAAGGPRKANKRSTARLHAVQALYQMDITGAGLNEILAQFESHWLGREVEGEQYLPAEAAFFRDIVSGVVGVQRDLDPRIDAALEATWPLKRIEVILRSVLRAGAYELSRRTDIPARVVVSEYVDVARAFVDKTETGMVNAVLDRLARNVRAGEFG
jgi:transcription antitermination protein NusB